jgi:hypothetical protein
MFKKFAKTAIKKCGLNLIGKKKMENEIVKKMKIST